MTDEQMIHLCNRVPLLTRVRGWSTIQFRSIDNYTWYNACGKEGIVMRHEETYRESPRLICQFADEINERSTPPRLLEYFINGEWLKFDQVMTLEVSS